MALVSTVMPVATTVSAAGAVTQTSYRPGSAVVMSPKRGGVCNSQPAEPMRGTVG